MAKAIIAVYSNPSSPELEDEFNTWYDQVHLKELLAVPGVTKATRYRLADGVNPGTPEHRYLALYELDTEPGAVLAELGSGRLASSDTLDAASVRLACWVPINPG